MPNSTVDFFHRAAQLLLAKDMAGWIALFAEDCVLEYPFAPPGWPKQLVGRAEVHAYLDNYPDYLDIREIKEAKVHETSDPEVIVAEFTAAGVVTATGLPFESRYIEVVTVRDGQFVHVRDYWNPMLAVDLLPKGLG